MRRIVILTISLLAMFILTACDDTIEETPINVTNDRSTLGVLSYISASFLDETIENNLEVHLGMRQLSAVPKVESPTTSIEDRIDQVNMYFDKLKGFIDLGTENLASIEELVSDRIEYRSMIRILVDENEYVLYFNEDIETLDITGLLIYDGIEYQIQTENSMLNETLNDDGTEMKYRMKLIARNGSNSIIIEYEAKEDSDALKYTFSMLTNIDGFIDKLNIEIKSEDNETVLTITENDNEYKFKFDGEEDENTAYKLDYLIDGVKGKVRIIESSNDFGETVYIYRIQERNVKIDIEMEDPDNRD